MNYTKTYILISLFLLTSFFMLFFSGRSLHAQVDIKLNSVSTRYAPRMDQLHITSFKELNAGATKGGEGGQRPFGIAVSPSKPEFVALITDTYGAWKCENGGMDWKICEGQPLIQGGVNIAFHPDDENIMFVAGSPNKAEAPEKTSNYSGIWRTLDGGKNWQHLLQVEYYRYESCNLISFGQAIPGTFRHVFIGSHNNGVYKSINNGNHWNHIGLPGTKIVDLFADTVNSRLIAISEEKGVMVADMNGSNWESRNNGLTGEKPTSIAVNPHNTNHWFLVSGSNMFESDNAGQSWTQIPRPTGFGSTVKLYRVAFGAPNPDAPPRLYCQAHRVGRNFRYSNDLGKTWGTPVISTARTFFDGATGYFYDGLAVHPTNPLIVYTDLNTGIFKSEDGGVNFYPANQGFSGLRGSNFTFTPGNPDIFYIAAIDHGLFRSVDHGVAGVYPFFEYAMRKGVDSYEGGNTVHSIAINPLNHDHLLMNIGLWGANNILAQSRDRGKTWVHIPGTVGNVLKGIWFHPQDTSVIYAGLSFSRNGGLTWEVLSKRVMAVSPMDGNTVYSVESNRLFVSRDKGTSWEYLEGASPSTLSSITRVVPDLVVKDKIWLGTNNINFGIILIEKDGNTFKRTNIGPERGLVRSPLGNRVNVNDIAQNPDNPLHLVAGGIDQTEDGPHPGLFETTDGGISWRVVPGMPGRRDMWTLAFQPGRNRVLIATSAGTFIYNFGDITGTRKPDIQSTDVNIYPNPNDGIFSLSFNDQKYSEVGISVFSLSGTLVHNQIFNADTQVSLNLSDQVPGMYFLKIIYGREQIVKKLIINR